MVEYLRSRCIMITTKEHEGRVILPAPLCARKLSVFCIRPNRWETRSHAIHEKLELDSSRRGQGDQGDAWDDANAAVDDEEVKTQVISLPCATVHVFIDGNEKQRVLDAVIPTLGDGFIRYIPSRPLAEVRNLCIHHPSI